MALGLHLKQVSEFPQYAWTGIRHATVTAKRWTDSKLETVSTKITTMSSKMTSLKDTITQFSTKKFKSIGPLNGFLMIGIPVIAVAVTFVAFSVIGPLGCTLFALAGIGITLGAWAVASRRIKAPFNSQAVSYLTAMETAAQGQNIKGIQTELENLKNKDYSHLEDEVKALQRQFDIYQKNTEKDSRKVLIEMIKGMKKGMKNRIS